MRQVTGRHNDTELHLAAHRGDNEAVKDILGEIDAQMMRTASGADFDAGVSSSFISSSSKGNVISAWIFIVISISRWRK